MGRSPIKGTVTRTQRYLLKCHECLVKQYWITQEGRKGTMKKSNFVIDYTSVEGKYYLFHTRYGSVVSVDEEKEERLKEVLANPDTYIEFPCGKILQKFGFFLPDEIDEYQQIVGRQLLKQFCENNYLELTLMPTEQCNFRCVYCYENFQKPAMSEFIQDAIVRFVRQHLANRKGLVVSYFGGEPLVAMDVIRSLSQRLMSLCREMKKPYIASMTTNGYLLNLETFEELQKLKVNHFQITVDGDRETHNRQRVLRGGQPTYDQILDNLNDIRLHARSRLWSITLRTNVTKTVIQHKEAFQREILNPFGGDRRFSVMLRKMWTNSTQEADSILCTDEEFNTFVEECEVDQESLYQEYTFAHDLNFICYAANPNSLVFGADGMVYKCTLALYDAINQVGQISEKGAVEFNEERLFYWIAPRAGKAEECTYCPNCGACASRCCPLKQEQHPCESRNMEMLRPYIPKFYLIAKQAADLTEEL